MDALIKHAPEAGLRLQQVPVPGIGINDVLIKILKTSICGTDVHIYNWDQWAQNHITPGTVIGHEFVGRVADLGSNVHDLSVGDLVSGEGHLTCGLCRNCLSGRRHLCAHTNGVGIDRNGAYAEYLALPVTNIWRADESIPLDIISSFDPLGNATHTALSFDVLGEDVLITGAGPIGCMAAAIAKHAGARFVVVTDVNPYRLSLAQTLGADRVVNVNDESLDDIQTELDMKEGFDVGMEMSGNPAAFSSMLNNMCHGGKIALLGLLPRSDVDWDTVVFNGITIKGIYGREMFETWYKMSMMLQSGMDISPIITHRFPYSEYESGFELMRSGQSGKVVLTWADDT
jgi:threonine 3-dehydrogenase